MIYHALCVIKFLTNRRCNGVLVVAKVTRTIGVPVIQIWKHRVDQKKRQKSTGQRTEEQEEAKKEKGEATTEARLTV